jgi:hypothetical protein
VRTIGPCAVGLACALVLARPLSAQSPADRAALTALRDTLATLTNPDAASAVTIAWTPGRGKPMATLRSAFIRLRIARFTGRHTDFQVAQLQFAAVAGDEPSWPYPWFGRALVELALAATNLPPKGGAGQQPGESNYAAFTRDAATTLNRDPAFPPLIALLVTILPPQGDREQPAAFVMALERASALPGAAPATHLVIGRAYRTAGDDAKAITHFAAYLATGGDSSVGLLEQARAQAGVGLPDARHSYLEGAAHLSGEGRQLYRDDLGWIASPAELATYDSLPLASVRGWIEKFWAARNAEELRPAGERLQEHLRRWAFAFHHFRIVAPERRTQFEQVRVYDLGMCSDSREKSLDDYTFLRPDRLDDYRRKERIVDHRAPIYIRHGEPWQRRTPAGIGSAFGDVAAGDAAAGASGAQGDGLAPFNPSVLGERERMDDIRGSEAWLYWFDGAPRVFFFAGGDELGRGRPTTLYAIPPADPDLLSGLADLDPSFRRVAAMLQRQQIMRSRAAPPRCAQAYRDMIAHTRGDVRSAITHDSYTLLFRKQLETLIQTFAMGGPSRGAGRIVLTFAADGSRLTPTPRPDHQPGVAYPLTVRVSAADSAGDTVYTADTTRIFVADDSLRAGQYLTGLIELPVAAGRYRVRAAVLQQAESAGTSVQRVLTTPGDEAPSMSDIVIEAERGGVPWENQGDPVHINSLGAFARDATAPIYYELSQLIPGHRYRTTIALRKANERKTRGVSLIFDEIAAAASAHVRRNVGLTGLRSGQYTLSVTLRDSTTGREATRDQLLNVTERK